MNLMVECQMLERKFAGMNLSTSAKDVKKQFEELAAQRSPLNLSKGKIELTARALTQELGTLVDPTNTAPISDQTQQFFQKQCAQVVDALRREHKTEKAATYERKFGALLESFAEKVESQKSAVTTSTKTTVEPAEPISKHSIR